MSAWTSAIDSILEPLLQLDPRIRQGLEGCTREDIATIEAKVGMKLPEAYVALLERIGRCRGQLMRGSDFGFPFLLGFREIAESLLEEVGLRLQADDLVIRMEQGYQFFFLRVAGEDDPLVYYYDDDNPELVPMNVRFSGWLRVCVDEELSLWKSALAWEAKGNVLKWGSGELRSHGGK